MENGTEHCPARRLRQTAIGTGNFSADYPRLSGVSDPTYLICDDGQLYRLCDFAVR